MTEFQLTIKRDNGKCDMECVFYDKGLNFEKGYCLLFKEPLGMVFEYGAVVGGKCSSSCNVATLNMKRYAENTKTE